MLSKEEAYEILELPNDAPCEDVLKRYKFLSLEWFPDKHHNSEESIQKFQNISQALVRLSKPCKHPGRELTMNEMISLFSFVFFGKRYGMDDDCDDLSDTSEGACYSSDSSDCDFYGYFDDSCASSNKDDSGDALLDVDWRSEVTSYITERLKESIQNATELIQEEEREKMKAEKRKAKKKRRKEKKKQKKSHQEVAPVKETKDATPTVEEKTKEEECSEPEEEIDPNSAFVAVIAKKKKHKISPLTAAAAKEQEKKTCFLNGDISKEDDENSRVLRSQQVAIRGNEMANVGCYQEAINLFTEAIRLNPSDHRFYGNRSYCFDRIGNFERALKDAEKSITLAAQWPKGYFRKGRALTGLQKYSEAEKCFKTVLVLDPACEDAIKELTRVQIIRIMELGFTKEQAEDALNEYVTVERAIEYLLSGAFASVAFNKDPDVFLSDDDDEEEEDFIQVTGNSYVKSGAYSQPDIKMDPNNPEGHNSVWIGNIQPGVTEKLLTSLFSKYGELVSIKVLPEKFCAFVNYKHPSSAGMAMKAMQGADLLGANILIRFPGKPTGTTPPKLKSNVNPAEGTKTKTVQADGEECYFWRTTGCIYGNQCRYKHIKAHKGIDKKDWHKAL